MQGEDKIEIEKKYTILIRVILILPVLIMFIYGNFIAPTTRERFIKLKLKCIVVDKYINTKNHNTRTIRVKDDHEETISEIIINFDSLVYNYVIPGDSIIKATNQDFVLIQRKDSIIKITIHEDGWLAKN